MHIIIFAGGTVQRGTALERALQEGDLVIAADSGARTALELGRVPAYVVGDFDSLDGPTRAELERLDCHFVTALTEKDETDTELAIEVALQRGASRVTLLGALGGSRFEHTIANLLLLSAYPTLPLELVDGASRAWLLRGPGVALVKGKQGDLLSLFPLTASANGITTESLYYSLHDATLTFGRPRGISNVLLNASAKIALRDGLLLLVHTYV